MSMSDNDFFGEYLFKPEEKNQELTKVDGLDQRQAALREMFQITYAGDIWEILGSLYDAGYRRAAPPAAAHGASEFFVDFDTLRKALTIYGLAAPVSNEELGLQMERQAVRVIEAVAKMPFPTSAAAHGDEAVRKILEAFPLLGDAGLDHETHHCEWSIQQERKRLHKLLSAMRAQGDGGEA